MNVEEVQALLRPALETIKKDSFNDDYKATDEEAMGLLLSRFCQWDGVFILRSAEAGLEDSNFHTAAGRLGEMAATEEAM